MNVMVDANHTLMNAIWPAGPSGAQQAARMVALVVGGTFVMSMSAKLHVPFWPVPMTMQTFATLVIGMAYGWRLAGVTILLYLAEGALGLPVFSGTPERGIGLAYMTGPTGGFLLGFALAAVAAGWLAEQGWDRRVITTAAGLAIANLLIYVPGVAWLALWYGGAGASFLPEGATAVDAAFQSGLIPFLPGDILKLALATAVLPLAWWKVGRG